METAWHNRVRELDKSKVQLERPEINPERNLETKIDTLQPAFEPVIVACSFLLS